MTLDSEPALRVLTLAVNFFVLALDKGRFADALDACPFPYVVARTESHDTVVELRYRTFVFKGQHRTPDEALWYATRKLQRFLRRENP